MKVVGWIFALVLMISGVLGVDDIFHIKFTVNLEKGEFLTFNL